MQSIRDKHAVTEDTALQLYLDRFDCMYIHEYTYIHCDVKMETCWLSAGAA